MCSHGEPPCHRHQREVGEIVSTGKSSMFHSSPKPPPFSIMVDPSPASQDGQGGLGGRVGVGQNSPPAPLSFCCPDLGQGSSWWVSPLRDSQLPSLTPDARLCEGVRDFDKAFGTLPRTGGIGHCSTAPSYTGVFSSFTTLPALYPPFSPGIETARVKILSSPLTV